MGIDLSIPGDPDAASALAEWLDPSLGDKLQETHSALTRISSESQMHWRGESGSAFRQTASKIAEGIDPVDNYARDAAEVFRAYGQRLKRGKEKFAGLAEEASNTWLIVTGEVVSLPMPPKQYISAPGTPPPVEYGPNGECIAPRPAGWYEEARKCYARIADEVGKWWGELQDWITEHLVPLIGRAHDFDVLNAVTETLRSGNEVVFATLLGTSNRPWEERLALFESSAKDARADYDLFDKRLRSGDPRVSSLAEGTSKPEIRAGIDDLDTKIKGLKVGTRILPGIGLAIDVGGAVIDVASGESVSSTGAGLAGGLIGGGATTGSAALLAGAGVSIPGGAVIVAAAIVTVLAAEGAKWAWEEAVPLDVREAIDAGDFGYVFQ